MLPGKRDLYHSCKARRSPIHVNKEFWQQFQNYAPPSLRVIRTKCCMYYNWRASEASETLSGLFNRESRYMYLLGMCSFQHKWASELQLYLFVLLHHVLIVVVVIYWTECMPRKFGNEIRLPGTTVIDNLPIPLTMTLS